MGSKGEARYGHKFKLWRVVMMGGGEGSSLVAVFRQFGRSLEPAGQTAQSAGHHRHDYLRRRGRYRGMVRCGVVCPTYNAIVVPLRLRAGRAAGPDRLTVSNLPRRLSAQQGAEVHLAASFNQIFGNRQRAAYQCHKRNTDPTARRRRRTSGLRRSSESV